MSCVLDVCWSDLVSCAAAVDLAQFMVRIRKHIANGEMASNRECRVKATAPSPRTSQSGGSSLGAGSLRMLSAPAYDPVAEHGDAPGTRVDVAEPVRPSLIRAPAGRIDTVACTAEARRLTVIETLQRSITDA
jgi:hypothetical protein